MTFRRIVILFVALLLLCGGEVEASKRKSGQVSISVISGERWWGLVVDDQRVSLPIERSFVLNTSSLSPSTFRANVLLSSRGRFLRSREPMTVSFDGSKIVVTPTEGEVVALEKGGRTLRESYLVHHHKYLADTLSTPPSRSGLELPIYELGGDDALLYTQEDVADFVSLLESRGAPKGVILLPLGWHTPSGTLSFDAVAYPDPKGMIKKLHKDGWRVMLTVSPYVMAAGRNYQRLRKAGMLLADESGQPKVFQSRYGYTACRALTEEGAEEMRESLERLQSEFGVDGYYLDMLDAAKLVGESLAEREEYLSSWREVGRGLKMVIYSSPVGGPDQELVCSVSTARQYTWEELQRSLQRCINAGLLGYTYTSLAADIDFGGDEALALRTAQLAALMPVAIIPYSVWSLECVEPFCEVLRWRCENGEYIGSVIEQSASTAEPIARHLEYQYPRLGFANCDDEYMFGGEWLVAPVVKSGAPRMVRLPRGSWREYRSGRVFRGPRVIDFDTSDGGVPIFQRVK